MEEDEPGKENDIRKQFFLDKSTSAAVIGSCSDKLQVRPYEIMMVALIYSFSHVFQDRAIPPVFTEGHGRGAWDESIDLSQTVGWFTTMLPVQVNTKKETIFSISFSKQESAYGTCLVRAGPTLHPNI